MTGDFDHVEENRPGCEKGSGSGGRGRQRNPAELKVQTRFDAKTRKQIERKSDFYCVSSAEIVRSAYRVYAWACEEVKKGRDVGSYDRATGRFVVVDIPFASEFEVSRLEEQAFLEQDFRRTLMEHNGNRSPRPPEADPTG